MPRKVTYRRVRVDFWTHPKTSPLSLLEKAVHLYLATGGHASCVHQCSIRQLRRKIDDTLSDTLFEEALKRMAESGVLDWDGEHEIIWLIEGLDEQGFTGSKNEASTRKHLESFPFCPTMAKFKIRYPTHAPESWDTLFRGSDPQIARGAPAPAPAPAPATATATGSAGRTADRVSDRVSAAETVLDALNALGPKICGESFTAIRSTKSRREPILRRIREGSQPEELAETVTARAWEALKTGGDRLEKAAEFWAPRPMFTAKATDYGLLARDRWIAAGRPDPLALGPNGTKQPEPYVDDFGDLVRNWHGHIEVLKSKAQLDAEREATPQEPN